MGKQERRKKKKIKRMINNATKHLRYDKYISVSIQYGAGHNALLYIFCPNMSRRQIREGRDKIVEILMKMEADLVMAAFTRYPKMMYDPNVPRPADLPKPQCLFAPQRVWHELNNHAPPNMGMSLAALFDRVKDSMGDTTFRQALITLVKEGVIAVLGNGFVWRRNEAKQKFGITLHEMRAQ